jgi:hypothetical protein
MITIIQFGKDHLNYLLYKDTVINLQKTSKFILII